jgi:hypothetical protein
LLEHNVCRPNELLLELVIKSTESQTNPQKHAGTLDKDHPPWPIAWRTYLEARKEAATTATHKRTLKDQLNPSQIVASKVSDNSAEQAEHHAQSSAENTESPGNTRAADYDQTGKVAGRAWSEDGIKTTSASCDDDEELTRCG